MANIKISELNSIVEKDYTDVLPIVDTSANETKKISIEKLIDNNVELLDVIDIAPSECSIGDKYYNTEDNLIYTAVDTDTWSSTGEQPKSGVFYIVFSKQSNYVYDGTTLVSVGGGSGDLIMVNEEPTEDTKLYIEDEDLEPQGLEIANEYNTADNMAYSCDYVNNLIHISEKGRVYTNQFTNFTFGSETFAHKDITFTKEYTNPPLVLAQLVSTTGRTLYGNIPAYVRSITNTSADLVITYNTNNTTTWVDYIVISMD